MTKANPATTMMLGVTGTIMVLMLAGGYTYTFSADNGQDAEKERWRSEHNRVLNQRFTEVDKQFESVRQGQDKIEKKVEEKAEKTETILRDILIEQRAANLERTRSGRSSGR